jgi:hypothetical protein
VFASLIFFDRFYFGYCRSTGKIDVLLGKSAIKYQNARGINKKNVKVGRIYRTTNTVFGIRKVPFHTKVDALEWVERNIGKSESSFETFKLQGSIVATIVYSCMH